MDFFAAQRLRLQRSVWLYGLFFVVIVVHALLATVVLWLFLLPFGSELGTATLFGIAVVVMGLSFIIASLIEWQRLKAGGRAVAQRVGAVRLFIDHSFDQWQHSTGVATQPEAKNQVRYLPHHIAVRHERDFPPVYRRYYEFASQMAIAAGVPMPILYVLPDEQGINGFVAGRCATDTVMVVTQGALDKLSDEGLYGLIGHEFGHILHGDAKFNIKLLVILGGLQLLYDWTDTDKQDSSTLSGVGGAGSYMALVNAQRLSDAPQSLVDKQSQQLQAQTAHFSNHQQWVDYWRQYHRQQQLSSDDYDGLRHGRQDGHEVAMLLLAMLNLIGYSGMLSAQLIKHSFNRQREYLADATSVQLTRSPAIVDTLKAIHKDRMGSRLQVTPETHGLSHFFFASSEAGNDSGWFATHPSIQQRMQAINQGEYDAFAREVAKQAKINQAEIKKIYEQRRQGTWNELKTASTKDDTPLDYQPTADTVVDGRLQTSDWHDAVADAAMQPPADSTNAPLQDASHGVMGAAVVAATVATTESMKSGTSPPPQAEVSATAGAVRQLKPWLAHPDSQVSESDYVQTSMLAQVSLPQSLLNLHHDVLGALAWIEAVALCHQASTYRLGVDVQARFNLEQIWRYIGQEEVNKQLLPHRIDSELLHTVAKLDRRLDGVLMVNAIQSLQKQLDKLIANTGNTANSNTNRSLDIATGDMSGHNQRHSHKQQQRINSLRRYHQGLRYWLIEQTTASDSYDAVRLPQGGMIAEHLLPLWQAVHLMQILQVLACLPDSSSDGNDSTTNDGNHSGDCMVDSVSHTMADTLLRHTEQQDDKHQHNQPRQLNQPCQTQQGQSYFQQQWQQPWQNLLTGFDGLGDTRLQPDEQAMMLLLGYVLTMNMSSKPLSEQQLCDVHVSLQRFLRLLSISVTVSDVLSMQWLQQIHGFNTRQLLVVLSRLQPQGSVKSSSAAPHTHTHWLSTLHTAMLQDAVLAQQEYDCLCTLAQLWLGKRQLVD